MRIGDERTDPHRFVAPFTAERFDFEDFFNQRSPFFGNAPLIERLED